MNMDEMLEDLVCGETCVEKPCDLYSTIKTVMEMRGDCLRAFVMRNLPKMPPDEVQELMWTVAEEADESFFDEFEDYYSQLNTALAGVEAGLEDEAERIEQRIDSEKRFITEHSERAVSEERRAIVSEDDDDRYM